MEESPSHIVLLNCDVCCSFPLPEMLEAHISYGGMGTILVIKVSPESANQFGELVADPVTNELLHYTEKPETFVSDRINCGVYIFTPDIFAAIQDVSTQRKDRAFLTRTSSFEALQPPNRSLPADFVRLDQDILSPLAGNVFIDVSKGKNKKQRYFGLGNISKAVRCGETSQLSAHPSEDDIQKMKEEIKQLREGQEAQKEDIKQIIREGPEQMRAQMEEFCSRFLSAYRPPPSPPPSSV